MSRVVVMNHVTLDGVMQGPGRPDEDTRDGFTHGGWGAISADDATGRAMGERMEAGGGLAGWLFGRRTYEGLLGRWAPDPDSPFGPALLNTSKYVASRTLRDPLPWPNSTLLQGDAAEAVSHLKAQTTGVLGIMGSGALIETLLAHNLIDELLLMVHPLVLGSGRRLFPVGGPSARFQLVNATTSGTGVVIAIYQASDPEPHD